MKKNQNLKMELCKGRHNISEAIDGAIFEHEISDVTNTSYLEDVAFNGIWDAAFTHYKNGKSGYLTTDPDWNGSDMEPLRLVKGLHLDLYITGLTVALIATLNVCHKEGVEVTLWHFDCTSGSYYPQQVG